MSDIDAKIVAIAEYMEYLSVLQAENKKFLWGQSIWAIDDVTGTYKKGLKKGDYKVGKMTEDAATAFNDLPWEIKPEASGAGGYTPFRVTIGPALAVVGNDTVITDYRLKGVAEPMIMSTVTGLFFKQAEMVVDVANGKVTLLDYNSTGPNDFIGIFIPSAIVTADDLAAFNARITKLELYAAPWLVAGGGGAVIWMRPVGQIPAGWREVTNYRGYTIKFWDPDQAKYNTVGNTGGSNTAALAKSNLPAAPLEIEIIKGHEFAGANSNIAVQDIGHGVTATGTETMETVETENMGDGVAFSVEDKFRIAILIEPIPV